MALVWPWGKTRRVRDALAAHPAFEPPHRGKGAALSVSQREANLRWFLDARASRTAAMRETMAQLGYALPADTGSVEAVEAASLAFHRLCHDHLIGWTLADKGLDERRPSDPAAIGIDGFGRDIGMVLGDAALTVRPALAWVIDNDKPMMTHGQIVIGRGRDAPKGLCPVAVNALSAGVHQLWQVVHTGRVFTRPNAFSFALDLASGAYERILNSD